MKRMHLDFLHRTRRRIPYGLLVLGLGIASLGAALGHYRMVESELIDARSAVVRAEGGWSDGRTSFGASRTSEPEGLAQLIEHANAILAHLGVPWNAMFDELERVARPQIMLLAIQQDGSVDQFRISGASQSLEDVLDYMQSLEDTDGFARVFLVSHEDRRLGTSTGGAETQFTLTAQWVGYR